MLLSAAAMCLVLACGLPGNALVALTVYVHRCFHTAHYFLLASLALCDFVTLASIVLPRLVMDWRTGDEKTSSKAWCISSIYLGKVLYLMTISHLCSVSHERYKAIVKEPLTYSADLTTRQVVWSIFVNWFLPNVVCIPGTVVHAHYGYNPASLSRCGTNKRQIPDAEKDLLMTASMPMYIYILPFMAMIAMNYVTIKVAIHETKKILAQQAASRESDANWEGSQDSSAANASLKKKLIEHRAAKDGLFIIGAFLVCYSPTFLFAFVQLFSDTDIRPGVVNECFYLLVVSNCACNPVIYSIRKRVFRRAVKRLIFSQTNNRVESSN